MNVPGIGFQLYSARAVRDDDAILSTLAAIGYRQIETYGPWHDDPSHTRRLADRHGLAIHSAHIPLSLIRDEPRHVTDIARVLGVSFVVAPYLDENERPRSTAAWRGLARELQIYSKQLEGEGLQLGWHNHDFEFSLTEDGDLPMDLLLDTAPDLRWEMDIGWTARSGQDVLAWIARHGHRIAAVHVKDIANSDSDQAGDGWCSVGTGTIDWTPILAAARKLGVHSFIAEHDNPPDAAGFAATSFAHLKPLLEAA